MKTPLAWVAYYLFCFIFYSVIWSFFLPWPKFWGLAVLSLAIHAAINLGVPPFNDSPPKDQG